MKHTVTKPGTWPFIQTMSKRARINNGVTITVTAKLVIRSGYAN
jgi:hypothetical protein